MRLLALLSILFLSACVSRGFRHTTFDPETGAVLAVTETFESNLLRRSQVAFASAPSGGSAKLEVAQLPPVQTDDPDPEPVVPEARGVGGSEEYELAARGQVRGGGGVIYYSSDLEMSEGLEELAKFGLNAWVTVQMWKLVTDGADVLFDWLGGLGAADAAKAAK